MKNTFKYLLGTLALAGSMVACSPEEFDHMSESGIIDAIGFGEKIDVTVDQSTNQVTFTLNGAEGIYPIWEIDLGKGKTDVSTVNGYKRILTLAGDYTVRCHIGNKNGISTSYVDYKFHINNSIVDFTKYTTMLSKAPWYIDNTAKGHLACGESGTEGTNWWSANPDEKAAFGVYDNALTFTTDMKYTFDPGAAGTLYANWGVTSNGWQDSYWSGVENDDFNVPVELQNTTYNFEVEGEDLYLTFPKGTYFPYIANDDIWNTPRYLVVNMTTKQMTLRSDNGGIAWQYILTTQHEVKEVFKGFDVNSEDNLWKQANASFNSLYYAHGGSWDILPDYEHSEENGVYTVNLPTATDNQWQAQYCLKTDLSNANVPADATYDFSAIVTPTNDIKQVTFKLTSSDDQISLIEQRVDLTGMEDNVVYFTELPGQTLDGNYKFVFDFGGNPDNTEIVIKDIVLIDHSKNKVSVPSEGGDSPADPSKPAVDWTGENLLAGMPVELTQYYAPGWSPLPDAEYTAENGVYTINYPSATTDQWQAQFTFNNTGIALDPEKTYDFRVKITSSTDHPGVTVKLTQQDDDNTFITEGRHPLAAFEETWIELSDLKFVVNGEGKGVINNLKMPFDFGGIAAGTEIVISEMHLQEHKVSGPVAVDWTKPNLLASMPVDISKYYAHGGSWDVLPEYEHSAENGVYTITLPTATDAQWQAQFTFNNTGIALDPAKSYDFRVKLTSNTDHPGVTVKLTQQDNDEIFLTEGRHPLEAFEETWIELVDIKVNKDQITNLKMPFDFGQNAADTEIIISDMHLQEH